MIKKRVFFWVLLFVSIFVMIVVNLGGTLGFFYGPDGKIITSSFNGEITLTSDVTHADQTYSNSNDVSNVFVITGGTSDFNRVTIEKGGNGNSENSVNGGNAAVLVKNQSIFRLTDGSITTDGLYADGAFSYNNGNIKLSNTNVLAKSSYSSGIVVSGGGIVISENSTVKTLDNYSPVVRNTEGKGVIQISGGNYESDGNNSAVLSSTASLFVDGATLVAKKSEGIVMSGSNSNLTMTNSNLTSTNTDLSDNSNSYKNIFMYQSGSLSGKSNFTATNNTITTNKGDTFYITNTKAVIKLTNNVIVNHDGNFIKAESSSFGDKGGDISLTMSKQSVSGNIVLDSFSILEMNLLSDSHYEGAINGDNKSSNVQLTISKDSTFSLTGDTYVTNLDDADDTYSNIIFNGHHLFVNGEKLVVGNGESVDNNGIGNGGEQGNANQNSSGDGQIGNGVVDGGTDNVSGGSSDGVGTDTSGNGTSGNSNSSTSSSESSDKNSSSKSNDDRKSSSSSKSNESKDKNSVNETTGSLSDNSSSGDVTNGKGVDAIDDKVIVDAIREELGEEAVNNYEVLKSDSVVSIHDIDSRTLLIINSIGFLFIITSIVSLIRLRNGTKVNN